MPRLNPSQSPLHLVAILQAADEEGATNLAERVRRAIETEKLIVEDARIRLTASFGVAALTDSGELESLIAAADDALYWAKREGRDRVATSAGTTRR